MSLTEHSLEEIPDNVFQLSSLRTLDLSKNKIKSLGKISQLSQLKSLNCDENRLHIGALEPISKLSKLQTLSLGKNRLHGSDDDNVVDDNQHAGKGVGISSFPYLPETLKQLKIHGNSLSSIPRQICSAKMCRLEKLDLSDNTIAAVPPEICNLVALTDLNLDKNTLVSLPPQLGQLKKLKTLSLRHNHIRVSTTNFSSTNPQPIPASVFEDTMLIDLNLHGNGLSSGELNEFEGFSVFMERRKKVKNKNLHGGALTDMGVCGLD
ncbi:hypothetical protein ACHAXS_010064 [Conticribra weissflogii]